MGYLFKRNKCWGTLIVIALWSQVIGSVCELTKIILMFLSDVDQIHKTSINSTDAHSNSGLNSNTSMRIRKRFQSLSRIVNWELIPYIMLLYADYKDKPSVAYVSGLLILVHVHNSVSKETLPDMTSGNTYGCLSGECLALLILFGCSIVYYYCLYCWSSLIDGVFKYMNVRKDADTKPLELLLCDKESQNTNEPIPQNNTIYTDEA